jgi:hypothetical protein
LTRVADEDGYPPFGEDRGGVETEDAAQRQSEDQAGTEEQLRSPVLVETRLQRVPEVVSGCRQLKASATFDFDAIAPIMKLAPHPPLPPGEKTGTVKDGHAANGIPV